MWRNNKGFSLLETLIASTIFFFVITSVLTQLYLITLERKNQNLQQFANQWLIEKLLAGPLNSTNEPELTLYNGIPFYFELQEDYVDLQYRGCVKWTNLLSRETIICGTVK